MKVVIDANVIISGLRFSGLPRRLLDLCASGNIDGFTSDQAIGEIEAVLILKFHLLPQELTVITDALRNNLTVVPVMNLPSVSALRDKSDLHILAVADITAVDYIVSGDKDLLILGDYKKIPIINVNDFMERGEYKKPK